MFSLTMVQHLLVPDTNTESQIVTMLPSRGVTFTFVCLYYEQGSAQALKTFKWEVSVGASPGKRFLCFIGFCKSETTYFAVIRCKF